MSANFAAIDDLVEEFLKMELISVPPYPGQLGYLGSNKVNGKWTQIYQTENLFLITTRHCRHKEKKGC